MTTITDAIRARLRAGEDAKSIALELGARVRRVSQIAWEMRNPAYKRLKQRFWRADNPGVDVTRRKRKKLRKLIDAERAHQTRRAERTMKAVG